MQRNIFIITLIVVFDCYSQNMAKNYFDKLNPEEVKVIVNKATEKPFSGEYNDFYKNGTYVCKACESPLFNSSDKFNSNCGWPSFDDEINNSIKRVPDYSLSRMRTEIVCQTCSAHLGHVFEGENFTQKNIRHCVNSISLKFVKNDKK